MNKTNTPGDRFGHQAGTLAHADTIGLRIYKLYIDKTQLLYKNDITHANAHALTHTHGHQLTKTATTKYLECVVVGGGGGGRVTHVGVGPQVTGARVHDSNTLTETTKTTATNATGKKNKKYLRKREQKKSAATTSPAINRKNQN